MGIWMGFCLGIFFSSRDESRELGTVNKYQDAQVDFIGIGASESGISGLGKCLPQKVNNSFTVRSKLIKGFTSFNSF